MHSERIEISPENFPEIESPRPVWLRSIDELSNCIERRAIIGITSIALACGVVAAGTGIGIRELIKVIQQFSG